MIIKEVIELEFKEKIAGKQSEKTESSQPRWSSSRYVAGLVGEAIRKDWKVPNHGRKLREKTGGWTTEAIRKDWKLNVEN